MKVDSSTLLRVLFFVDLMFSTEAFTINDSTHAKKNVYLAISKIHPNGGEIITRRGKKRDRTIFLYCNGIETSFENTATTIRNRFGFESNFGRWKYLQKLLDEDESIEQNYINTIIYLVLAKWIQTSQSSTADSENNEISDSQRTILETLITNGQDEQSIPVFRSSSSDNDDAISVDENIFQQIEQLLPDPIENEDAFKGLWDTVIELHGREAVKINERNKNTDWVIRNTIARILIHFDFLAEGI